MPDIKVQPPPSQTAIIDQQGAADRIFLSFLNQLRRRANIAPQVASPPATATSAGAPGQVAYDADFLYICIAKDTWRRTGISAW